MSRFAVGARAHGFCDVCGFRCLLSDMKDQFVAGRNTKVKACPTCNDPDHPQNFARFLRVRDPQALRDPRPDPALQASRGGIIPPDVPVN